MRNRSAAVGSWVARVVLAGVSVSLATACHPGVGRNEFSARVLAFGRYPGGVGEVQVIDGQRIGDARLETLMPVEWTDRIPCRLGTRFGVVFGIAQAHGAPGESPFEIRWEHPAHQRVASSDAREQMQTPWPARHAPGRLTPYPVAWVLSDANELKSGPWVASVVWDGRVLASKQLTLEDCSAASASEMWQLYQDPTRTVSLDVPASWGTATETDQGSSHVISFQPPDGTAEFTVSITPNLHLPVELPLRSGAPFFPEGATLGDPTREVGTGWNAVRQEATAHAQGATRTWLGSFHGTASTMVALTLSDDSAHVEDLRAVFDRIVQSVRFRELGSSEVPVDA